MSRASSAALVPQQEGPPGREQIRERVRRDVERALREARQAKQGVEDAQRAVQEGGPPGRVIMIPPVPGGPGFPTTAGTGRRDRTDLPDIPQGVQDVSIAFFITVAAIFIGTPIARAFGRRMDRRPVTAAASPDVVGRLDRIEQAVDAIALEVERISEGQRYVTKVMSGPRSLPAANDAAANEVQLAERAQRDRANAERVP